MSLGSLRKNFVISNQVMSYDVMIEDLTLFLLDYEQQGST